MSLPPGAVGSSALLKAQLFSELDQSRLDANEAANSPQPHLPLAEQSPALVPVPPALLQLLAQRGLVLAQGGMQYVSAGATQVQMVRGHADADGRLPKVAAPPPALVQATPLKAPQLHSSIPARPGLPQSGSLAPMDSMPRKPRRKRARILRDGQLTMIVYGSIEALTWARRVAKFQNSMR